MTIRVGIIEDEHLAMNLLADYVEKLTDWDLVLTSMSAENAIPMLEAKKVDLLFSDINLPGLSGIEMHDHVQENIPVIYTTSYLEYVHQAFTQNAIDYLLKPVSEDRFLLAIRRYLNIKDNILFAPSPYMVPVHVNFTTDTGTFECSAERILYIESYGGLSKVTFIDTNEIILVKQDIQSIHQVLGREHFIRTHRLFIANKYFASKVMEKYLLVGNYNIPLAKNYVEDVLKELGS